MEELRATHKSWNQGKRQSPYHITEECAKEVLIVCPEMVVEVFNARFREQKFPKNEKKRSWCCENFPSLEKSPVIYNQSTDCAMNKIKYQISQPSRMREQWDWNMPIWNFINVVLTTVKLFYIFFELRGFLLPTLNTEIDQFVYIVFIVVYIQI